jgi:hypothetical protein
MEGLSFNDTNVSDLRPLANLLKLKRIRLANTKVISLAPISNHASLEGLTIEHTKITDLKPIAQLTNLQDAALKDNTPYGAGLFFKDSTAAEGASLGRFSLLRQPRCTIETINTVRRECALPEYFPKLPDGVKSEKDDREQLAQKPASHSFVFHQNRIEALAQSAPPRHPEVAADIRDDLSKKAKEAATRLVSCNAPGRVVSTVNRLDAALGTSLTEVRAGILQMRFRSLEADVGAYDTEDGRRELREDALSMLRDLLSSVEDLMGCFPQLADIEAERLAQRLKDTDVPKIMDALFKIRHVAETSEVVAPSAIEALKAGEPELEHDSEIIYSGASDAARVAARNARDRTVGYMLLVYRNFVAGAIKAGTEITQLGAETWTDFRKKAPEQFSDASIALVVAALVGSLLGPTAAVGAFAVSFKPLRDRAKKVTDKLSSLLIGTRDVSGATAEQRIDRPA